MNEQEYREHLKTELARVCGKYLDEVKYVPSNYISASYKSIGSDFEVYRFYVEDPRYYGYKFVNIHTSNNRVTYTSCNCQEYYSKDMCRHIAACLFHYIRVILPKPPTKEEITKKILDSFDIESKSKNIKEKMNLEVELDLDMFSFRLRVGLDKLYVLSDNKFREFRSAYKKDEYKLGAKFTYDPSLHYFSIEDEDLFRFLSASSSEYTKNSFLSEREMEFLLDKLKSREFTLKDYGTIKKIVNGLPSTLRLSKEGDKHLLKMENLKDFYFPYNKSYKYLVLDNVLYILDAIEQSLLENLTKYNMSEIELDETSMESFKNGMLKKIKNSITVDDTVDDLIISGKPDAKIYLDFNRDKIEAKIKLDYKGTIIDYFDNNESVLRDEEEEENIINNLTSMHFLPDKKAFYLSDIDDIGEFFESGMSQLAEKYEVFTSKKIDATNFEEKKHVTSMFSIGMDGIMSYTFDTGNIKEEELPKIFASLKNKKKYYRLKNGNLLNLEDNKELDELQNVLDDLNLKVSDFSGGSAVVPKYRAFYIDSLKDNKYGIISTDHSFDNFINTFKKYKKVTIKFDKFDNETLRDYQKDGVKWLYTLYKCDLGGILADEMGLGKSIQTISFIKQILKEKSDAKIMIVCPTALIYNWKKEFDKFGSNLKYVTVAENKANRKNIIEHFDDYNVFITSYGLIRNDNDEYQDKEFELCVIDEAQAIKNYQAGMTKEIKKIKARTKIALTGTPIENSVFELWSIFDFIMPGYLNSITSFRENYGIKEVDAESLDRLSKLNYQIKPFILRRKKKDVVESLPDKIENNIYLELPDMQKALYMKVVKETEEEMNELIATSGFQAARFKILQLLTKLREICIDPRIVYDDYKGESIKIERLTEIVKDLVLDGHKILIFSSFKTVINNVKEVFDKESISNYVIAGDVKSKTRMELVEKFNTDDTNCFLITLKSGGTGLNLTGADIVIHLDIWWNPQAENQATDRAHRIGQDKKVTVIRLITKGTIEERIMELQNKKRILSDNLIEGKNDSKTISNLSEKDMKELLAIGHDE